MGIHHALFEGMSTQILTQVIENKLLGETQEMDGQELQLSSYIENMKQKSIPEEICKFIPQMQKAYGVYQREKKRLHGIDFQITLKLDESEKKEFLRDPILLLLKAFVFLSDFDREKFAETGGQIPFAILTDRRDEQSRMAMGMYLDMIPGLFSCETEEMSGGYSLIAKIRDAAECGFICDKLAELSQNVTREIFCINYLGTVLVNGSVEDTSINVMHHDGDNENIAELVICENGAMFNLPVFVENELDARKRACEFFHIEES